MSTDYHWAEEGCEPLEIGRSAGGWAFALRVYPSLGIEGLEDWQRVWKERRGRIVDFYDREISAEQMLAVIVERSWPMPRTFDHSRYRDWDDFYEKNACTPPDANGLYRMKVDGADCVGHGPGPWDLVRAEARA